MFALGDDGLRHFFRQIGAGAVLGDENHAEIFQELFGGLRLLLAAVFFQYFVGGVVVVAVKIDGLLPIVFLESRERGVFLRNYTSDA